MKVIDLRCGSGHRFEGWFASDEDFLEQNGRSLIECPLCADKVIVRMPSAPRLNLSGAREPVPAVQPSEAATTLQSSRIVYPDSCPMKICTPSARML